MSGSTVILLSLEATVKIVKKKHRLTHVTILAKMNTLFWGFRWKLGVGVPRTPKVHSDQPRLPQIRRA